MNYSHVISGFRFFLYLFSLASLSLGSNAQGIEKEISATWTYTVHRVCIGKYYVVDEGDLKFGQDFKLNRTFTEFRISNN